MKKIAVTLIILFNLVPSVYSQTAKTYFDSGMEKMQQGNNQGAIQDLNRALELNPNYINAYAIRGQTKVYLGDYRGAIKDFTRALELNPTKASLMVLIFYSNSIYNVKYICHLSLHER